MYSWFPFYEYHKLDVDNKLVESCPYPGEIRNQSSVENQFSHKRDPDFPYNITYNLIDSCINGSVNFKIIRQFSGEFSRVQENQITSWSRFKLW